MNISKFSMIAFCILLWASSQGKIPAAIKAAKFGQIYLIKETSSHWGRAMLLDEK